MSPSRRGGPIPLGWKLLLSHLLTVVVVLGLMGYASRLLVDRVIGGRLSEMAQSVPPSIVDSLRASVNRGVDQAILVGILLAVALAVLVGSAAARWVTHPLVAMADAARKIAGGRYEERVDYHASDEIGDFSRAFNDMAGRLEETERVRTELLATIAHELRTPLTSIQGYMEGLLDGVVAEEPQTYDLVRREAQRLSRLVDDLQRLSRLEAGAERFEPRAVEVGPALNGALACVAPQFEQKSLRVSVDPAAPESRVWVDPDKLQQVLLNLLANARQYTPEGGLVRLRAEEAGETVMVSVEDTGVGIPEEDLPHVFERFYRVEKSRSTRGGGAGIGLAIARSIVRQSGGSIQAESRMGEGTTVSFTLPRAARS